MKKFFGQRAAGFLLVLALLPGFYLGHAFLSADPETEVAAAEENTEAEKHVLGFLTWPQNLDAVRYEVEIYDAALGQADPKKMVQGAAYRNIYVFSNRLLLPAADFAGKKYFYRIRAYDLDGKPITDYSQPKILGTHLLKMQRQSPLPRAFERKENGTALLYPVYSFTGNPGAEQFEVEVTSQKPENPHGIMPSRYRIFSEVTPLTNLYDKHPRIEGGYWRVRGLSKDGQPVGEWSEAVEIPALNTQGYEVGIYGDSISHGGGHLSFSPEDFAYSYAHYLDFPTVNLSESGDTSGMMVERFDRDVSPFRLKYLLIMGGSNSLRAGVSADDVISDLKTMQARAREYGMRPIFLTLAPINPENIQKAFRESTAPGWQERFAKVNAWIRSQPHIDTAAPLEKMGEKLPTVMGLDGLHGDWRAKKIMGGVINRDMKKFMH